MSLTLISLPHYKFIHGAAFDLYTNEKGPYYSEFGSVIHKLKYDGLSIEDKENLIDQELMPKMEMLLDKLPVFASLKFNDLIIAPIPSSSKREYQHVYEIAKRVASYKQKPYHVNLLRKNTHKLAKYLKDGSF